MTATVLHGDCLDEMQSMEPNSKDAIVCDPPYGFRFMGKDWDHGIPGVAFWREALRVAKPGAHMVAFGGTRTFHRLACAIEDAGWEIRDTLMWLYGSGFPKSRDVSKAIDQEAGAEREIVKGGGRSNIGTGARSNGRSNFSQVLVDPSNERTVKNDTSLPATDLARQWQGWGTALKPAWEPIILARKPLAGTVAATVSQYGTGGLNIDGCRIASETPIQEKGTGAEFRSGGRWPANVVLSHSPECREVGVKEGKRNVRLGDHVGRGERDDGLRFLSPGVGNSTTSVPETVAAWECAPDCAAALLDAQSGERKAGVAVRHRAGGNTFGGSNAKPPMDDMGYGDTGCASRFYYVAKASRREREAGLEGMPVREYPVAVIQTKGVGLDGQTIDGKQVARSLNHHPTVKPLALMRWLCRLVTPPGGRILDPFAGSFSTACAAELEGFDSVSIEREADYCAIGERRIAHWSKVARRYHRLLAHQASHPVTREAAPRADPRQPDLFSEVA